MPKNDALSGLGCTSFRPIGFHSSADALPLRFSHWTPLPPGCATRRRLSENCEGLSNSLNLLLRFRLLGLQGGESLLKNGSSALNHSDSLGVDDV
jgi:hypothetical protein